MILTHTPENFTHADGLVQFVSHDLYDICGRIKREVQFGETLRVVYRPGRALPYAVMEECVDGKTRWVASYETLDARVIDDLNRIVRQDVNERLREVDRQIEKEQRERRNAMWNNERMDYMMHVLEKATRRSNLFDLNFSTSYPLRPNNPRAKTAPNG